MGVFESGRDVGVESFRLVAETLIVMASLKF